MASKLILAAVAPYLVYGATMVALHTRFIYPFDQTPFAHPAYDREDIAVEGAEDLAVYVARSSDPGAATLIYFMGNAGALDLFLSILEYHREQGLNVVAMTFRGGGGETGTPSETRLKADALAVFDRLPALGLEGPVLVHGYSLGSGLALHLAARRDVAAVLLSAPYDQMCRLMASASWLPACILPFVQTWKSTQDASAVRAPVTILHGDQDSLIPPQRSHALQSAFERAGAGVSRTLIPGAAHADLMAFPAYLEHLDAFVDLGQQSPSR